MKKRNKGFTLVELIVVIAILGVVAVVLVPQYIHYVDKAKEDLCETNRGEIMRQMSLAVAVGEYDSMDDAFEGLCTEGGLLYSDIQKCCPSGGEITWDKTEQTLVCSIHGPYAYFSDLTDKSALTTDLSIWLQKLLSEGVVKNGTINGDSIVTFGNLASKTSTSGETLKELIMSANNLSEDDWDTIQSTFGKNTAIKFYVTDVQKSADKKTVESAKVGAVFYKDGSNWIITYTDTGNTYSVDNDYMKSNTQQSDYAGDEDLAKENGTLVTD